MPRFSSKIDQSRAEGHSPGALQHLWADEILPDVLLKLHRTDEPVVDRTYHQTGESEGDQGRDRNSPPDLGQASGPISQARRFLHIHARRHRDLPRRFYPGRSVINYFRPRVLIHLDHSGENVLNERGKVGVTSAEGVPAAPARNSSRLEKNSPGCLPTICKNNESPDEVF